MFPVQILNTFALVTFGLLFAVFLVVTAFLNYHWSRYGIHLRWLFLVRVVYVGVSTVLFLVLGGFLIYLTP